MSKWPGDSRIEQTSFGNLSRGELMSRVRGRGNLTTEERLASLLRTAKLHGWRRHQPLPGRPDFVWRNARVVVFVDGCFWHGHRCGRNLTPKTNVQAWEKKIEGNRSRDRRTTRRLRKVGWSVVRIWECQLSNNPDSCLRRIRRRLPRG